MPDQSQTAVEQWNITTLKAYLEQQVAALRDETTLKFEARDGAQKLQFAADQDHFVRLNNENGRLLKQQESSVSRDTYTADQKAYLEFKEKVNRQLDDQSGRSKGFDAVRTAISFIAGVVVATVTVYALLIKH